MNLLTTPITLSMIRWETPRSKTKPARHPATAQTMRCFQLPLPKRTPAQAPPAQLPMCRAHGARKGIQAATAAVTASWTPRATAALAAAFSQPGMRPLRSVQLTGSALQ